MLPIVAKKAKLPYDVGNAGDFLKHGLLAEFTEWWCETRNRPIRFLDPFAGRPWEQPNLEVVRRLDALGPCALKRAQTAEGRYYGSSYVVLNAALASNCRATILISDRDPVAVSDFGAQFEAIEVPGFDPVDAFSILRAPVEADLLLLDPFGRFLLDEAPSIIPQLPRIAGEMATVLFVLNLDPRNRIGRDYDKLRREFLRHAWCFHCPQVRGTAVKGEDKYQVDLWLIWSVLSDGASVESLWHRMNAYARQLTSILGVPVALSIGGQSVEVSSPTSSRIGRRDYNSSVDWHQRISVNPSIRSGKPCIRGTRITVYDILEYLAGGMSEDDILRDFPDLTRDDIRAALAFAAARERRLANSVA